MLSLSKRLLALSLCFAVTWAGGCCCVPVGAPCGTLSCGNRGGLCCAPGGCGDACDSSNCAITSSSSACDDSCECPGLLHGKIAQRIKTAILGGCCSGCGEVYFGEQCNEPPVCDPCSGHGEFTGTSCGTCKPLLQRVKQLWGRPYRGNCGCEPCGPSCIQDVYASNYHETGYCPSCKDGVAGQPSYRPSATQVVRNAQGLAVPTRNEIANSGVAASPESTPATIEPLPDPNSDRPMRTSPTPAKRSPSSSLATPTTSQANQRQRSF